jgi:hypothetical protein
MTNHLVQKHILDGSLILNMSDEGYDKLFYDGNMFPKHLQPEVHNLSPRCNVLTTKAPAFPAVASRTAESKAQWRLDLGECARGDYIAIVTVVNNQAHRIVEWVVHNLLVGVDFIQICDDCSVDNLRELLQPFIENGHVRVDGIDEWNMKNSHQFQSQCYDWFWAHKTSSRFTFIANYDVDEFIVPSKEKCITPAIERFEAHFPNASGLLVPWSRFSLKSTRSRINCTSFEITSFSSGDLSPHKKVKSIGKPLCNRIHSTGFPPMMPHMCQSDHHNQNLYEDGRRPPGGSPPWSIDTPTIVLSLNLTIYHYTALTFEDFVIKAFQRHWMKQIHHSNWPTSQGINQTLAEWENLKPTSIHYSPHVKLLNSRLRRWLNLKGDSTSCAENLAEKI